MGIHFILSKSSFNQVDPKWCPYQCKAPCESYIDIMSVIKCNSNCITSIRGSTLFQQHLNGVGQLVWNSYTHRIQIEYMTLHPTQRIHITTLHS